MFNHKERSHAEYCEYRKSGETNSLMPGFMEKGVSHGFLKGLQVQYKLILSIACIYMVFIGGCVSKAQLDTVSTDYRIAQEQLADREKRDAELQRALEDSKKETDQCLLDQDAQKKQIDTIRYTNILLSLKIDALNQTIMKKEKVISLQKTVIRMFDDSDQTLQTSIQEQSNSLE